MFIVGAGTLRYGDIVEVIDAAKGAGRREGRHRHRGDAHRRRRLRHLTARFPAAARRADLLPSAGRPAPRRGARPMVVYGETSPPRGRGTASRCRSPVSACRSLLPRLPLPASIFQPRPGRAASLQTASGTGAARSGEAGWNPRLAAARAGARGSRRGRRGGRRRGLPASGGAAPGCSLGGRQRRAT